jgi:hypothetical protein
LSPAHPQVPSSEIRTIGDLMPKLKEVTPRVRVGRGVARHNLTIFPLYADEELKPAEYVPVGIAIREGLGKITEISESGSVPRLAIDNLGISPILILDGEELLGARQNRIANITILAPAKKTIPIPVSCVERGRWHYHNQTSAAREFTDSPQVMNHKARALKMTDVSRSLADFGAPTADQGAVWHSMSEVQMKMGFISPTEAMSDLYEKRRESIDDYLADIKAESGQIGAIFAINGKPAGVELFDSTETFATYLPKIMRSYALDALANRVKRPDFAADKDATRLLDSILELDARSFPAEGLGEDLRIEATGITGGALAHNGRVVHLAAFQTN